MFTTTLLFDRETKNKVRYSSESGDGLSDIYIDKAAFDKETRTHKNWPDTIRVEVTVADAGE